MTPEVKTVTEWLIDLLERGTSKPVGDHEVPDLPAPSTRSAYCVVYSIPGGAYSGSLALPDGDAEFAFQVTSGGHNRAQAQWMADLVRRVILDRTPTGFSVNRPPPAGWAVNGRRPLGGSAGVDIEGNHPHQVFSVPDRYTLCVTPA